MTVDTQLQISHYFNATTTGREREHTLLIGAAPAGVGFQGRKIPFKRYHSNVLSKIISCWNTCKWRGVEFVPRLSGKKRTAEVPASNTQTKSFSERNRHEVCGGKVTLLKPVDAASLASLECGAAETHFKDLQAWEATPMWTPRGVY